MNQIVTALLIALAIAAVGAVVAAPAVSFAAIQCVNPGGGNPQGNCQGANENQNPAGKAPPGQN